MAKTENKTGQVAGDLASNLARLQELFAEGQAITPSEATAQGYAPATMVDGGGRSSRAVNGRLQGMVEAGLLERVKVRDSGHICNWYRPAQ